MRLQKVPWEDTHSSCPMLGLGGKRQAQRLFSFPRQGLGHSMGQEHAVQAGGNREKRKEAGVANFLKCRTSYRICRSQGGKKVKK